MRVAELVYRRVFLLVTAALVCFALLGHQVGDQAALIVLVLGVALLGLPHGALDPLVAGKAFADAHHRSNTVAFFCAYAGLATLDCLLWINFPTIGLVSFLLIAAFHFGCDWQQRGRAVTRLAYGITVVTLPAAAHPVAVAGIYALLGTSHSADIVGASRIFAVIALTAAIGAAAFRCRTRKSDLLEILGIAVGACLLQPLIFFTCYFTLLHSPRHLFETARMLGIHSLREVVRKTFPIVGVTVIVALCASTLLHGAPIRQALLTIVFVGLASLTVPHMLLDKAASLRVPQSTSPLPVAAQD